MIKESLGEYSKIISRRMRLIYNEVKKQRVYRLKDVNYSPGKGSLTVSEFRNKFSKVKFNDKIQMKKLFLPENFAQILQDSGLSEKALASACSFLGVVYRITQNKDLIHREFTYAHIHSFAIRQVLTRYWSDARSFLDSLYSLGFLETDGDYKVGTKSTGYRIGPALRDLVWIEQDWNSLIKQLPEKSGEGKSGYLWNLSSQYFSDWRDLPEGPLKETCSRVEGPLLRMHIKDCPELHVALRAAADKKYKDNVKAGKIDPWPATKIYNCYIQAMDAFNAKEIYVRADAQTGRIFTNICNMKKELRDYLYIGEDKIVSQDAKCMQPCLLLQFLGDSPEELKEKSKFIEILNNGDIYSYLAADGTERKEAKIAMYVVMFAKTWSHQGVQWDKFAAEFPILSGHITALKLRHGFKCVSKLLQTKEADIMIQGVLNELLDAGLEIASCHDAILSRECDAERVRESMIRHFSNHMGFAPVIVNQ